MALSERTRRKHEKEKAEIDEQMKMFGDLPADYDSFVRDTVFDDQNYIFYSSKEGRAYCTKCGSEFEISKENHLRHNKEFECPMCKKSLVCKSEGMSRQSLFAVEWSVLVQKHEECVLIRYCCHTKDFRTDYHHPKVRSWESYRTVHTDTKASDYEWARFKSTDEYRWCHYKEWHGWWTPSETAVPRSVILYNTDLKNDIAGTCMKYSAVDVYIDKVVGTGRKFDSPWCLDWYFNAYRRKPYLEQLLKVGFYKLVKEDLESRNAPELKTGRTIMETLGVTKTQYNMLRKLGDPTFRDVAILKYGQNLSENEFEILRAMPGDDYHKWYEKYIDMRGNTTIYKLDKYLRENGVNRNDYFDYVRWLGELGYNMRSEFNLYPRNFRKAHDEMSGEYIRLKSKVEKEKIEKFNLLLKELRENAKNVDAMNLNMAGMFIRLPFQLDEIKKEGEVLHHCVGTYVNRVAKGDTAIFFVRKESEPDKPFYTMEWKNNGIVQCRGFKNCDMTPEVKAFTALFEEKMKKTSDGLYSMNKLRVAG